MREEEKEIEKKIEEILRNQFVDRARPEEKEDHWGVRENTKKLSELLSSELSRQRAELLEKIGDWNISKEDRELMDGFTGYKQGWNDCLSKFKKIIAEITEGTCTKENG